MNQPTSGVIAFAIGWAFMVGSLVGWVLRDARARGLPPRKAATWAALHLVNPLQPLFLLLYRRIRPKRIKQQV